MPCTCKPTGRRSLGRWTSSPYAFGENVTLPVDFLQTDLVAPDQTLLKNLNASRGQLVLVPANGGVNSALHVPLVYKDYTGGSIPATVSTNPTVKGVGVTLAYTSTADFLLDTGSTVTMISNSVAKAIGLLDQNGTPTETPVTQTQVMGIGGTNPTISGYTVSSLTIPLTDGTQLRHQ